MNNEIGNWLKQNGWSFLIAVVGVVVAWTLMQTKIEANAKEIDRLGTILERVIVLEEHDSQLREDISEIKMDIKEIRSELHIR